MDKQKLEERLEKIINRIQFIQFGDWISESGYKEMAQLETEMKDIRDKLFRIETSKSKVEFIEKLRDFYINEVGNDLGITNLEYDFDSDEVVVVSFPTGFSKFKINYCNNEDILKEFIKFLYDCDSYTLEEFE